jgi:hypothetical protein
VLELLGLVVVAGDPAGHVAHGRRFAGRIVVREGFAEYRIHSRTRRVSDAEISEFDMTLLVVEKNLDLFRHHFNRDDSANDITRDVLASKPSRLVDPIRMAEFDLEQALAVARRREFALAGIPLHEGSPGRCVRGFLAGPAIRQAAGC